MSEAEDDSQPHTSTQEQPTPIERRPRSRAKALSNELNESEKEELLRKYAATDQNLEKFAQTHNMTALNVKSILRSLIKDHRALARVLGTDAPDDLIDGVRITRSKTRALQDSSNNGVDMTSNVPIRRGHSWVDHPFNEDDEYDNDYRPGDDSDEEKGSDSSQHESSDEYESEHLSEFDNEGDLELEDTDLTAVEHDGNDSLIGINSFDLQPGGRPGSSASLTLNAINDDDEPSVDYRQFVNTINLDNIPYDDEEDPEYMVPTDAIFRDERDEWAGDYWSSTIPQKEMEGLIEDIVPSERYGELAKNLDPPLKAADTTRTGTKIASSTSLSKGESEKEEGIQKNVFSHHHRIQLRSQMEQHVQLLAQSFVGCYFEPLLQEEKEKYRNMLETLSIISSSTVLFGKKSAFHISNLSFAVDTCNAMVDKKLTTPIKPLAKEDLANPRSMLPITKEVLGSSKAILYPHIVSQHRLVQSIGRSGWNRDEVILFAMAIDRYRDEDELHRLPQKSRYSIIAINCLPWRTMNELRWQYNGMKRGLERNGRTRHNREFFDVAKGELRVAFSPPLRAKTGWTMMNWQKNALPQWFNYERMKRKYLNVVEGDEDNCGPEKKKLRNERRIEEGDEEMEAIVILESDDEEIEILTEKGKKGEEIEESTEKVEEEGEKEEEEEVGDKSMRNGDEDTTMIPLEKEDRALKMPVDSKENNSLIKSPEEIESVRGDEKGIGGEGQPIDFSHLMREMSPTGRSLLTTPPMREERATSSTPSEKTILPATPGKRFPSPSEESTPWFDMTAYRNGYESPPSTNSPPANSRIKTPGGTMDYVDSLIGYFGTPEKEMVVHKEDGVSTSKKSTFFSNLFGDFDFDDSIGEDEMTQTIAINDSIENQKSDERIESKNVSTTVEDKPDENVISPVAPPVKQRKKRTTREEKEKIGVAAINDPSIRLRVKNALAKKAADDIRSRMNMHSSVLKQIQNIISQGTEKGHKEEMFTSLIALLEEDHKEALYLLSAFVPSSVLPHSLVLSPDRRAYVDAINIMCIIHAYMNKIQRRLSFRQLFKFILEAHSSGGNEKVHKTLKEVLVNDPLLLRALSEYFTPSIPSKKSAVWECIDLRKGEDAFLIFKENPHIERVDICEVMGVALTKKMLVKKGKTLSTLMLNHEGEPLLRNKDGKYKAIAVMTEGEREEEKKNKLLEIEEEKRAKYREKIKEKRDAVKKEKKAAQREERAKEKKKEKERKVEEEERKKEEREAPPIHPWNIEIDKALLIMYNEVQKVTKRAVRKMAVDLPYFTHFTIEQLQSRLDFLLKLAEEE